MGVQSEIPNHTQAWIGTNYEENYNKIKKMKNLHLPITNNNFLKLDENYNDPLLYEGAKKWLCIREIDK